MAEKLLSCYYVDPPTAPVHFIYHDHLDKMKVVDLNTSLKARGLSITGNKSDMKILLQEEVASGIYIISEKIKKTNEKMEGERQGKIDSGKGSCIPTPISLGGGRHDQREGETRALMVGIMIRHTGSQIQY